MLEIAWLLKYGDSHGWIEDEKKNADLDARGVRLWCAFNMVFSF